MKGVEKLRNTLLYGGLSREDYAQVQQAVEESNQRSVETWSIMVAAFWCYCLAQSLHAYAFMRCRPAYLGGLLCCAATFLMARLLLPRAPRMRRAVMYFFELTLIWSSFGIAAYQYDTLTITMFAVAIIAPCIYLDSVLNSAVLQGVSAVIFWATCRNIIEPEIFSWSLTNFIFFSVVGILIGNVINKDRFERYLFADSAQKLAEMQTRYAYFDQMTGLKNRRAYNEDVERLRAAPSDVCVVMADVNGLKQTNDTLGHEAGDELIIGAARCLSEAFGGKGEVYRLGGDEFGVLFPGGQEAAMRHLVRLDVETGLWRGRYVGSLSLSYGMDCCGGGAELDEALKRADRRMYENKRTYYTMLEHDRRKP